MASLDALLVLQEHDLALDRLRHRLGTLPERDAVRELESRGAQLGTELARLRVERDERLREERRLESEARKLDEQATGVDQRLYSGEVTSPRELQALQADVEQLRRHQRAIEDAQLEVMEQREPLDAQVSELEQQLGVVTAELERAREALAAAEAGIAQEVVGEQARRDEAAAGLDARLVADYEDRRAKARGTGAARLVGTTCQGCHLTIPSTEVAAIRKAPEGSVSYCDNCGCILVPS